MIRMLNNPISDMNSISSEEMLILQARILASVANLVKNSKFLEIFPSEQLLGSPGEEEMERLHHYYDNALKNKSGFELTSAMEKEIGSIPQTDKNRFIDGMFKLVQDEAPISDESKSYIIKVAKCFDAHQAIVHLYAEEVKDAVEI